MQISRRAPVKLELQRESTRLPTAVLGKLLVDGLFECYTLEDPDGAGDRIDAGTYGVIINYSNRFKKQMPLLTGPTVDGRGIRIHSGNTQADTEGCILVGRSKTVDSVIESRKAFDILFKKLQGTCGPITLTVRD
jgi:hypothetical protein